MYLQTVTQQILDVDSVNPGKAKACANESIIQF